MFEYFKMDLADTENKATKTIVLTEKMIKEMDHTDLLRLATRKEAKEYVKQKFGLRGVPIKNQFKLDLHQVEALDWIRRRERIDQNGIIGGMVCMTMGLGKTFTALTHILSAPIGEYPTLVIMSKTLLQEWKEQGIEKFFDFSVKALYFHKDYLGNDIKRIKIKDIKKYDIVLTTYDICLNICKKKGYHEDGDSKITECCTENIATDRGDSKTSGLAVLYCIPWNRIICDESQRFANHKTLTYKSMMALCGKYKWCLTGTPIRNYDTDIWAQLRFLGYKTVKTSAQWKTTGFERMERDNLRDVILTMNYDDANVHLVPKHHKEIRKELSGNQKKVYDTVLKITQEVYDMMLEKLCSWSCVLAMFTRLRQCVIAPYLLTTESKRSGKIKKAENAAQEFMEEFETTEMYKWCCNKNGDAGIHSVKIKELIGIVESIPKGEKVIIFSIFTSALDLVAASLEDRMPNVPFVQVDGDVIGSERSDLLNQFREDKETKILLLTYKVGSEGLNITAANHCICLEPWWSPTVHDQACSRCWRRGQTKDVYVYFPIISNTIEERIMELCKQKGEMAALYLDGTRKPVNNSNIDKQTMADILNR